MIEKYNCPPNCENRSMTCHSDCQRYKRYKLIRLIEIQRRARAVDEIGFHMGVKSTWEKNWKKKRW